MFFPLTASFHSSKGLCVMAISSYTFCVMNICVMLCCIMPFCAMRFCVMPFCVMSLCVIPLYVMAFCLMSLCVMPFCVMAFCVMPLPYVCIVIDIIGCWLDVYLYVQPFGFLYEFFHCLGVFLAFIFARLIAKHLISIFPISHAQKSFVSINFCFLEDKGLLSH